VKAPLELVLSTLHRAAEPLLYAAAALHADDGAVGLQVRAELPHLPADDPEGLAVVRSALEEQGLVVRSLHAPSGPDMDLSAGDAQDQRLTYQAHVVSMKAAVALGCDLVVVHPGHRWNEERERHVRLMRTMAALQDLTTAAEQLQVRLALENLPTGMVGSRPLDMANLVDFAGSPQVGACLDAGHALLTDTPLEEWVAALAGRIWVVEWHDNGGTADDHLPPSPGRDWRPLFAALRDAGCTADVVLEIAAADWPPVRQALEDSAALLQRSRAG